MALTEYEAGKAFPGRIGRTVGESDPAWPKPNRAQPGAPNVVYIVLDDTGYGQFGCYGSPINTPNLDRLAQNGLLYTNMHTTALCSPSHSCMLTGRNHHSNGMACITEGSTGFPGSNGAIPFENGFLSEMLLAHGYATYCVGKWHLTPAEQVSAAGPYDRWPLGRGFERYYGFLGGDTHQYYPDLVFDNHQVDPPKTPGEGYHLTEDLTDRAISFIADLKQVAPDKPFFLYYATGANHAPHQAPPEWAHRYRGKFDDGWDAYREKVFARQKELGIVRQDAVLSGHDPDVQRWDELTDDERRLYARMMEVFAGFFEHTDHQIGRLLDYLESTGQLDNTLIMVISDNGASAEGGPHGSVNENKFFNNVPDDFEQNLAAIDELGGPKYFNHYPWGWTFAGNTPFRRWKRETYRGGVADGFIVHWPAGIAAKGEVRHQYGHVSPTRARRSARHAIPTNIIRTPRWCLTTSQSRCSTGRTPSPRRSNSPTPMRAWWCATAPTSAAIRYSSRKAGCTTCTTMSGPKNCIWRPAARSARARTPWSTSSSPPPRRTSETARAHPDTPDCRWTERSWPKPISR